MINFIWCSSLILYCLTFVRVVCFRDTQDRTREAASLRCVLFDGLDGIGWEGDVRLLARHRVGVVGFYRSFLTNLVLAG